MLTVIIDNGGKYSDRCISFVDVPEAKLPALERFLAFALVYSADVVGFGPAPTVSGTSQGPISWRKPGSSLSLKEYLKPAYVLDDGLRQEFDALIRACLE